MLITTNTITVARNGFQASCAQGESQSAISTHDPFAKFSRAILSGTRSATSSPGLVAGQPPLNSLIGRRLVKSGPHHAHANRLASAGKPKPLKTKGIYGPCFNGLLQNASPESSLVNKLRLLMPCGGSTLYLTTWKLRTTPAKRSIWQLRALARNTLDSVCSGWPTPKFSDTKGGVIRRALRSEVRNRAVNLTDAVLMVKGLQSPFGYLVQTAVAAALNPEFSRYLMGFPIEWDQCSPNYEAYKSTQKALRQIAQRAYAAMAIL